MIVLCRSLRYRRCFSTVRGDVSLTRLCDDTVHTFRVNAFSSGKPALFPVGNFERLPARTKWFQSRSGTENDSSQSSFNYNYLQQFRACLVPIEKTVKISDGMTTFSRDEGTFGEFLDWSQLFEAEHRVLSAAGCYVAQCSISTLPDEMQRDIPMPAVVKEAGRGDIYDSSIWLGTPPTYTPLHKDPNPNLFVQLSGIKLVKIFEPEIGLILSEEGRRLVFSEQQRTTSKVETPILQKQELPMAGLERNIFKELVWKPGPRIVPLCGWEAELKSGDGVFIPAGWWHSIRSIGTDMIGSVNWWFR